MDKELVFDHYSEESRDSKRHKFNVDRSWDRIDRRDNKMEKPELTDELKRRAVEALVSQLVVR